MSNFCKNEDCPPSERLLAFQTGDVETIEGRAISAHMSVCEFCAAEVEFYEHYPPVDEKIEAEKMPEPLFELAEALLGSRHGASLTDLSREIDRLHEDDN
ncbi:MAG TPA: hypothetical protein VK468_07670 [Pyrinomonadaceae bacterium]|nr:hypothetical protein [Pyrinomonadaceae bacterium]